MSRAEKIQKLGNAIRAFRGCRRGEQWVTSPKPDAANRVVKYLAALGMNVEEQKSAFSQIINFQTFPELDAWIVKLDAPHPLSTAAVMGGAK